MNPTKPGVGIPVTLNNVGEVADTLSELKRIKNELAKPFDPKAVKFKPSMVKNNRALAMAYIDARLVMDRLDKVVGIAGWRTEYLQVAADSVECRLSLRLSGEWVTKADVGSTSEQPDAGDRMKAAYSDALKRAAVQFGIGRYLYRLPSQWCDYDPVKKRITQVPQLPAWAVPADPDATEAVEDEPPEPTVPDNPALRARHAQAYAHAKNRDAFLAARTAVVADAEAGKLSSADIESLRKLDGETAARFPKPVKA